MRRAVICCFLFSVSSAIADSEWNHNGSIVTLHANGEHRTITYARPRPGLSVEPGTVLFEGKRSGTSYNGTAYKFSKHCGPINYAVIGIVSEDERAILLHGNAPRRDKNCRLIGHEDESLVFSLRDNRSEHARINLRDGSVVSDPAEIKKALELLSASFACPLKPKTRKEVHDGAMNFYWARVFSQKFTGNQERLAFSFSEHFTQKDNTFPRNNMEVTYHKSGLVRFADLAQGQVRSLPEAEGPSGGPRAGAELVLHCQGEQLCYSHKDGDTATQGAALAIEFCDEQTADNALLAVQMLVRANR